MLMYNHKLYTAWIFKVHTQVIFITGNMYVYNYLLVILILLKSSGATIKFTYKSIDSSFKDDA